MFKSQKQTSWTRKLGKAFIAGEVIAFFGCYFVWRKLNHDQVHKVKIMKEILRTILMQYTNKLLIENFVNAKKNLIPGIQISSRNQISRNS